MFDAKVGTRADELFMVRADDFGGVPIILTANDGLASKYPDIAFDGITPAITWYDERDGNKEVYLAAGETLGRQPIDAAATRVTRSKGESIGAYLTWVDHRLAVAWSDEIEGQHEVYVQAFAGDARPASQPQRLTRSAARSLIPSIRPRGAALERVHAAGAGHARRQRFPIRDCVYSSAAMKTLTPPAPAPPSRKTIALATLAAAIVAAVLLVTVILPVEYGVDPLGTGRALGLSELASPGSAATDISTLRSLEAVRPGANTPQPATFKQQVTTFELGPFESMEYKYRVDQKGAAFVYAWSSSAPVNVDFHGEPEGAPKGTAEFYDQSKGISGAQGTFYAPSPGIHGWYWENQGADVVTVKLTTAGFYAYAIEFRQNGETTHLLK